MTYLKSGHRIVPLIGEEGQRQIDNFEGSRYGSVRVEPGGWFFTAPYLLYANKYYDFKFKPKDTIIHTYAKSGTTWTQEIIWTLIHNPDLNNPKASLSINNRSPNIEGDIYVRSMPKTILDPGEDLHEFYTKTYPDKDPLEGVFLHLAEVAEEPRVIKTHIPLSLLAPNVLDTSKVIYLARQPKDVVTSFYDFARKFRFQGFRGSLDSFIDHVIEGTVISSPYWEHLRESWNNRNHPNMFFCYFEDLKSDHRGMVVKFKEFLGLDRTDQQIDNVVHWTSFDEMKKRDNLIEGGTSDTFINKDIVEKEGGGFFNKGKTGAWKNKLTPEQAKRIDDWTREHVKDFDGDFRYKNI